MMGVKVIEKMILNWIVYFLLTTLAVSLRAEELNEDFFELSLQQLADIQVTSVAKKSQSISMAASSVYVLTEQDIRRSGVTTIADALRLVPGVQVAKLDANKWAISIRGFNDVFSNKLLILMDGRTVYTPFFAGVYWDSVDTVLQNIDRIEVIRGPGGTLWGANAVNGVINIISKKATETPGLFVSALAGNEETGQLNISYGDQIDKNVAYRLYAKGFEKDAAENGEDDWRMGRVGFRVDGQMNNQHRYMLQSEIYQAVEGERAVSDSDLAPFGNYASDTDVFGAHFLLRWDGELDSGDKISFQSYYDRTERTYFFVGERRHTFDVDFQHRFQLFQKQEWVWGGGFRYITDEINAGTLISVTPDSRTDRIYSAFLQDEISLIDKQLVLTLGSKFEHNAYTGFEYQPSARLLWKPLEKHSLWASVSRAVRVPSRVEADAEILRARIPGIRFLKIQGNRDMDAEELLAYEWGYRYIDNTFNVDLGFFYNDYTHLRTVERKPLTAAGDIPLHIENQLTGESYGFEFTSSWQVNESWRLVAGYSLLQIQLHLLPSSTDTTEEADEGDSPHHQMNFSSYWQVSENWQFDTHLRYVDTVKAVDSIKDKESVKAYVAVDGRIAWQADERLSVSLVGQNLLGKHREFRGSTVETQATDVEPSVYFKIDINF